MRTEELSESIRNERTAVFGAGYVAGMLGKALKIHGLEECPEFYLISQGETAEFRGKPVRLLRDTPADDRLILIAVHEANYRDADRILAEAGWTNRIWIYPYLHELLFGPVLIRKQIGLKELLAAQDPEKYWIAVRMCGVEGHKDIYCRLMALHAGQNTAEQRYEKLQSLKRDMQERGYDAGFPILIDEQYRIIDGLHRIALCRYFGLETIPAEIVRAGEVYEQLFGDKNQLPPQILAEAELTEEEIEILKTIRKRFFTEGEY